MSAGAVRRLAPSRLVSRRGRRVSRRGDERAAQPGEPGRGLAVPGARIRRARVEPSRRTAGPGGGGRLIPTTLTSATATLLVVLPAAEGGKGLGHVSVAGLPVERRIVLAAQRAGFGDIVAPADVAHT